MFYFLSQYVLEQSAGTVWEDRLSPLRLFGYLTFRSAGAAITALLLSLWLGPKVIAMLKHWRFGQDYLDKAEEGGGLTARVISKKGVPTMGGVLIITVFYLTALLWTRWNELVELTLMAVLVLAGLGFYDDYAKITRQNNLGAKSHIKLWVQGLLALAIGIILWQMPQRKALITEVMVPFYKNALPLGLFWSAAVGLTLTVLTIVGSSNAVNLTDGLDGLAIGCTTIVAVVFLVLTYISGNKNYSEYLFWPYVPGAGELTVICAALIGAGLGFLWFNCHPAQVFMGDTGSLALGGALGVIAVLIHQPLVLLIAGGVFVAEALSVILQRGWFKYTKRRYGVGERIFLMAPLHHHFEKLGWYESQVVTRFFILCVLCAVAALSTLKLR
ncbi:MAG: phospho-N-acetylmuramoyl-pentapeptide-transferase [Verrucomicrobia bacterium]|nr:phospho-N-acetylmuramoyl-pentapeptide-transferase [Verrucomicrobiota bacterium]